MPDLTAQQANDLAVAAETAALLPSQRAVVPMLCQMAGVDPVNGRPANTALLLDLLRGDKGELRAAFEVAGRILAGGTRPDGQVISVGKATCFVSTSLGSTTRMESGSAVYEVDLAPRVRRARLSREITGGLGVSRSSTVGL
ncbi:hypothetical protein ACFVUW_11555 [Streptomyces xiamenensis]|uniref:hypothetical protein n=1 Tax=Streptomyces xiamenensis TaxID=408015 RepID=UPI0036EF4DBE